MPAYLDDREEGIEPETAEDRIQSDAAKEIDKLKDIFLLDIVIGRLALSGDICRVKGHNWDTWETHRQPIRKCQLCGLTQTQEWK